jgi:putative tryptophan/tyrosine transport system substrate-binding protein
MAGALDRLTRRRFVQGAGVAGLSLLSGCQAPWSRPPPAARRPTLGFLIPGNAPGPQVRIEGFRRGLAEHGYVDGRNVVIEFRFAEGRLEELPALAAELVDRPVDVLFASSAVAAQAAKSLSTRVPVVMVADGDPVQLGLVASFAHPGGNLTGVSNMAAELSGKRLQMLTDVAPRLRRVAVLWNSTRADMRARVQEIESAAYDSNLTLLPQGVAHPADVEPALQAVQDARPDGLMVVIDPLTQQHQGRILDFAAELGLPAIYEEREWVVAGGLMAYGPNISEQYRNAAGYVARILEGAKPAELPIDQAMTFDFTINLQTAQALGLAIPQHVLLQATEVIQ